MQCVKKQEGEQKRYECSLKRDKERVQNAQAAATEALVAALTPVAPVLGARHRVGTRETCGLPSGSMTDEWAGAPEARTRSTTAGGLTAAVAL